MSDIHVTEDGNHITISLGKDFNYNSHTDFFRAFKERPTTCSFTVDMSQTESIDSAGLGLLIALYNHAGEDKNKVALNVQNEYVLSVLKVAKLEQLFTIK